MPYRNIPKEKWADMESCVSKVRAKGNVKNIYAVCYASIMRKGKSSNPGYSKHRDLIEARKKRREK